MHKYEKKDKKLEGKIKKKKGYHTKILRQNLTPCLCFVNKILLEFSPSYSFTCCHWLLLHYNSTGEQLPKRLSGLRS